MPLVENCFKHIPQNKDVKNVIKIEARVMDDSFYFETVNTASQPANADYNGIGLSNVRKRLELIYPGRYSLTAEAADGEFKLVLTIKIK
ncbi:MAG: GHKL domain-containing protein [Bacteroidota bacterium]